VFPALRRIEDSGWARAEWGISENNRRARYYAITSAGRKQLAREREGWRSITLAIAKVLEGA
jgi:DNA-binding PadR family transcriptional regulator